MKLSSLLLSVILAFPLLCQAASTVPITKGPGLTVQLFDLDLEEYGIETAAVSPGIRQEDGEIQLPIGAKSELEFTESRIDGGRVLFKGGIQLTKGNQKIIMTGFVYGVKSNTVTANVDGQVIPFFSVDATQMEVIPTSSPNEARFIIHDLILQPGILNHINAFLGLKFAADVGNQVTGNSISFDIDLSLGGQLKADLAEAVAGVQDLSTDLGIHLL